MQTEALTLYTDRLVIAPLTMSDLDLTIEMFTDPEVVAFGMSLMTPEYIQHMMNKWTLRAGNGCIGIWSVADRASGESYGTVALLPLPIKGDETDFETVVPDQMPDTDIEIGYYFKRSAWGKGFASEASRRIVRFAFEQTPLNEVVATFSQDNLASKNVLLKAGFRDRGTMRCYGSEGLNYRITRDEWLFDVSRQGS